MSKPLLFIILSLVFNCIGCQDSISDEAKELTTNFMEAYKIPVDRGEMSKMYPKFTYRSIYNVKAYQTKNVKKISDTEIHSNIETTILKSDGQQETKSLRLILTKENDNWTISDSKGIGNLITSYAKEFGFGIKAGCFTKNIQTLTDQQFLAKIKRSNILLTQLAQKESVPIAQKLAVEDLKWKIGSDMISGLFGNQTEYSFREVGFLIMFMDAGNNEIGKHNDILKPVKRGFPFNANENTPFSNKLNGPVPSGTNSVDIQFFINPNEIADRLSLKQFIGNECAGIL